MSEARDEADGHRPSGVTRRWWPGAVCCILYVALAMIAFGHFGSLGPSQITNPMSADVMIQTWWLAWTAFALPHGHNVFAAQWLNYPAGQNFGVNGSMLALGVLFAPITKVFGPIVSWNIAVRLALAVSASSMCLVLRRWVTWWPAAFVGGLLYGFSAYALTFASGYLFLVFVPLPPVFFLLLHEILVRQRWRPSRLGVLLGVVCCLQFFIWSEILAGMVFIGAIATCLFLLVDRHRLEKMWRYAARAFVFAGAIGGALLAFPVAYTLFGPENTHGSPSASAGISAFPSDLLGSVVPNSQWLSTTGLTAMSTKHFPFSYPEYIGIPLIVVLVGFALLFRKQRMILFTGAMALICFILSLGSRLWIDGHNTSLPLPWAIFGRIPVLTGFTPVRFSLFTSMFAAAMFSIGLVEVRRRLRAASWPNLSSPLQRAFAASGLSIAIALAVVLPLVPADVQPSGQTNIPSFFTSSAVDAIPEGGVVLSYPYGDTAGFGMYFQTPKNVMLDQAASGMRFKLIGGYGWFAAPNASLQTGTTAPAVLTPRSVQAGFGRAYWAKSSAASPFAQIGARSDLRTFLGKYHVAAVVVQPQGGDPTAVVRYVTGVIGCPAYYPGVAVWLHVQLRLADKVSGRDVDTCPGPFDITPHPVVLATGSTVSGRIILASETSGFLKTTGVSYYLSGGSLHNEWIASSSPSGGSAAVWNTRTVPNGRYVLRSVAVYGSQRSSTSSGIPIVVKN